MMVDPLEVMIAYVQNQMSSTIDERVAAKHRFNEEWTLGDPCIVIRLDGGEPDLYAPIHHVRLEVDLYAETTVEILTLWGLLVTLSRATNRETVAITGGVALLQNFSKASELSFLWDEDLQCDYGIAFFDAIIAEEAVE